MRDFERPTRDSAMMHNTNTPALQSWVAKIESRLKINPHDAEAWLALARDAGNRPVDQMRTFWERSVTHFPTHPYFWQLYIGREIQAGHHEEVEKLFSRCLHKIPSVGLNLQHVRYVTQTNPPHFSVQNREKIREAYDQAVARVGFDVEAGPLYHDYITFLESCEAVGPYAEQQRSAKMREVWQKAVAVPLAGIEHMWKDYCQFEATHFPAVHEKVTKDRSYEYINAKKQGKALVPLLQSLRRDKLPSRPRTQEEERHQIGNWRKWIDFERANPLMIDDANKLMRRIAYAYENCLMCCPYRIDIWLETAAHYRDAADKAKARSDQVAERDIIDAAAYCMERGIVLYPDRALFYLIIADLEEYRKSSPDRVKRIFDRCLGKVTENPTLAYIHYMLWCRRAETIKEARAVFARARAEPNVTQEIYVAAALMEYFTAAVQTCSTCSSKDKRAAEVALRIFELACKKFVPNAAFYLTYVNFLVMQNDQINAKILVEKALAAESLTVQEKLIIAGKSLEFDTLYGDYESIQKTERSRAELMAQLQLQPSTSPVGSRIISRWNYLGLTPINEADLKNIDYVESRDPVSLTPRTSFDLFKDSLVSKTADTKKPLALPDLNAMIPFKPRRNNRGFLAVPGGDYAFPEAIEQLKRLVPPPESFAGPFPDVDQVIRLLLEENAKSTVDLQKAAEGIDAGIRTIAQIVEMADEAETERMRLEIDPERRNERDIYRLRQAKKLKVEGAE
ncbi:Cleavage stimulation factor subunit 3 [Hypsibius exemplaris]|uniref:Cleavage stimulation factor subunit 3 n=1 Tax=Hypsibius exemplaris TaxID=2072580 RepID=A0A1W0X743_HYPEX|nr:Cleavage stimulation factor subunit 3 [Hypsibius exemplaris]OQV23132.1 Cleavage stimulation factor subunit 3 [Hypsibius exemplaris]